MIVAELGGAADAGDEKGGPPADDGVPAEHPGDALNFWGAQPGPAPADSGEAVSEDSATEAPDPDGEPWAPTPEDLRRVQAKLADDDSGLRAALNAFGSADAVDEALRELLDGAGGAPDGDEPAPES